MAGKWEYDWDSKQKRARDKSWDKKGRENEDKIEMPNKELEAGHEIRKMVVKLG
jgi:hypothetical protein